MNIKLVALLAALPSIALMLASKDADIEAGIVAYEAQQYDEALARFDAAKERRGDRPEIAFNRGLVLLAQGEAELARGAFETASEAAEDDVRGSAYYELGNLELDAEAYDAAIEDYIEALKARPDHQNAKWNLELALSLKQKQEEEQEDNEDEQEQEDNEDEQEQEDNEDEQEQEDNEDEQEQEDNEDEQEQNEDEQEQNEDEPEQDEQEQNEDEPEQNEESEQDEPQPQPQALDKMDVDKALEQLDEQDPFTLDRPLGGYVQPDKDW